MDEEALQAALAALIETGAVPKCIEGQDRPRKVLTQLSSETYYPSFPIDYLLRKQSAPAATFVLSQLQDLTPISAKNKSISITRGEALYPDFLFLNAQRRLVLFEIKRSSKTERETLTELLAYEQEIKNHLPFLSNDELLMVVVATQFSPLLDHSLAVMIAWERRRILCLRAAFSGDTLKLTVHLPHSWAPIGEGILPPGSLSMQYLSVRPKEGHTLRTANLAVWTAIQMIARHGDRNSWHGFAILGRDVWYGDRSESPYGILIGLVDPYRFLPFAGELQLLGEPTSPLAKYLLARRVDDSNSGADISIAGVATHAIDYLTQFCEIEWHPLSTWDRERAIEDWNIARYHLNARLYPLHMEFWGNLGDYLREMLNHPALRAMMPSVARPGIDWTYPRFGIAMINQMALSEPFQNGVLTCRGMCHLGIRLGKLVTALAMEAERHANEAPENSDDGLEAVRLPELEWAVADALEYLHEIAYRFQAAAEITDPPPSVTLKGGEQALNSVSEVAAFVKWIAESLIRPANIVHYRLFNIAGLAHALYESGPRSHAQHELQELEHKVVGLSRNLLAETRKALVGQAISPVKVALTARIAREKYNMSISETEDVFSLLDKLIAAPDSLHVAQFVDGLPDIADVWVTPIGQVSVPLGHFER